MTEFTPTSVTKSISNTLLRILPLMDSSSGNGNSGNRSTHTHGKEEEEEEEEECQSDHDGDSISTGSTCSSCVSSCPSFVNQQEPLGHYRLVKTLGVGEFGKIKLGIHTETHQKVAIKIIKKRSEPAKLLKVEHEIQILKSLRHPHIVKLIEVVDTDTKIGIILEYASGGELFEYVLSHRSLDENIARNLFAQLISSVKYMHVNKGIAHRDLKLENILFLDDEQTKLIVSDFGFANDDKKDLLKTTCGSPIYAAPELVFPSSKGYNGQAADIWSLGIILYCMVCGYLPFDDDPENPESANLHKLYQYIKSSTLSFADFVSTEAQDLIRQMLQSDPSKRCNVEFIVAHPWLKSYNSTVLAMSTEELEQQALKSIKQHLVSTDSTDEDTHSGLQPRSHSDNQQMEQRQLLNHNDDHHQTTNGDLSHDQQQHTIITDKEQQQEIYHFLELNHSDDQYLQTTDDQISIPDAAFTEQPHKEDDLAKKSTTNGQQSQGPIEDDKYVQSTNDHLPTPNTTLAEHSLKEDELVISPTINGQQSQGPVEDDHHSHVATEKANITQIHSPTQSYDNETQELKEDDVEQLEVAQADGATQQEFVEPTKQSREVTQRHEPIIQSSVKLDSGKPVVASLDGTSDIPTGLDYPTVALNNGHTKQDLLESQNESLESALNNGSANSDNEKKPVDTLKLETVREDAQQLTEDGLTQTEIVGSEAQPHELDQGTESTEEQVKSDCGGGSENGLSYGLEELNGKSQEQAPKEGSIHKLQLSVHQQRDLVEINKPAQHEDAKNQLQAPTDIGQQPTPIDESTQETHQLTETENRHDNVEKIDKQSRNMADDGCRILGVSQDQDQHEHGISEYQQGSDQQNKDQHLEQITILPTSVEHLQHPMDILPPAPLLSSDTDKLSINGKAINSHFPSLVEDSKQQPFTLPPLPQIPTEEGTLKDTHTNEQQRQRQPSLRRQKKFRPSLTEDETSTTTKTKAAGRQSSIDETGTNFGIRPSLLGKNDSTRYYSTILQGDLSNKVKNKSSSQDFYQEENSGNKVQNMKSTSLPLLNQSATMHPVLSTATSTTDLNDAIKKYNNGASLPATKKQHNRFSSILNMNHSNSTPKPQRSQSTHMPKRTQLDKKESDSPTTTLPVARKKTMTQTVKSWIHKKKPFKKHHHSSSSSLSVSSSSSASDELNHDSQQLAANHHQEQQIQIYRDPSSPSSLDTTTLDQSNMRTLSHAQGEDLTPTSPGKLILSLVRVLTALGIEVHHQSPYQLVCLRKSAHHRHGIKKNKKNNKAIAVETAPIYGPPELDQGHHVDFTVEICRSLLSDLYVVDIQSVHGEELAFQFIKFKVLAFLHLNA